MNVNFSRLQIMTLLLLSIGISNHLVIVPHLLKSSGRDAWLSIFIAYAILIIWCLILYFILKSMKKTPIQKWIEDRIGKFGYWLICAGIVLYLLAAGIIIVYDSIQNIEIFFLPNTPSMFIIFSFIFVSYNAASGGLKTIVYMSVLLLPLVWLLEIAVNIMTSANRDYQMLLPLLTDGIASDIHGIAIILGCSIDLLFILFIQHRLNKPLGYGSIIILLTLLMLLIMGPTIGSITAFGPHYAGTLRFPTFEQWRLVSIGRYISHIDFLAVFQLMAGSIVRTALILLLLSQLISGDLKKPRKSIMIISAIMISLPSLFKFSDIKMHEIVQKQFYIYSLWFGIALTIVLFTIRYIPSKKEKNP